MILILIFESFFMKKKLILKNLKLENGYTHIITQRRNNRLSGILRLRKDHRNTIPIITHMIYFVI